VLDVRLPVEDLDEVEVAVVGLLQLVVGELGHHTTHARKPLSFLIILRKINEAAEEAERAYLSKVRLKLPAIVYCTVLCIT
jgi:hypothetical protein